MSAQHTRKGRHLMWCQLGDMWEQAQQYLALLALTVMLGGAAVLFGLALAETAGHSPALAFGILLGAGLVALAVWRWRVASRKLDAILRETGSEFEAARAAVNRSLELIDAPPGYLEVWDRHAGCVVCSQCGAPVALNPCKEHGPAATDRAALEADRDH